MEAKTLVELFDERPLENVLGVEIFRPEKVIYICPEGTPEHARRQLKDYFAHRGIEAAMEFLYVNIYDTQKILELFRAILKGHPDAVMDITGGTDAVLFAAGLACSEAAIPVVTYSRTMNKFYSIQNAPSMHGFECDITFSVEDCFLMAGGSMRKGRVDNSILSRYMDDIDPFFEVFLKYRRRWDKIVTYIQRVSAAREDGTYSLSVQGDYTVKGEQGARLTAFELVHAGITTSVQCDNMASLLLKSGRVKVIFVGCDRVAANGDAANKIGTSGLAIIARHYGIPFYVCAPSSTIDMKTKDGEGIPIEMRDPGEIREMWYREPMAPAEADTSFNPAFDVTDHHLITGIITEKGLCHAPYDRAFEALGIR